jgi:FHA domain-containing protein
LTRPVPRDILCDPNAPAPAARRMHRLPPMITITITTHNSQPMASPLSANFTEQGGTIGRAPENALVLLDSDRKISRTHATVSFRDGRYILRDQGSAVPTIVNGQPLGHGREAPLSDGDEIRIGPYVLRVAGAAAAIATAAVAVDATAAPAPAAPEPGTMSEPVLSWATSQPSAPGDGITTVFVAGTDAPGGPAAPTQPAPPAAIAPAAGSMPAPTAAPAAANAELLRALLAGAGLKEDAIPGGLTPELMRNVGRLLHEATRGLLDLLAARASTKRQVRADMTMIAASDNNPLKFSPDLEAALAHFLVPRGRGFMPPLRAVDDAYEDLRSHQQGFVAGMRSALAVVLARFDPHALEQRAAEQSMVDSFLPTNRKAKLWDQFGQLYGEISKEAENDFHTLFGEEFLKAYREHTRQIDPGATRIGR